MAKQIADVVNQQIADFVIANTEEMTVCEGEPSSYAEASQEKGSGGLVLARVAISGGDITKAPGDVSGDKFVVAAKNNVDVLQTGNADHVVLLDNTNTRWLFITTAVLQAVTSGNQVNIGQWQNETRDPQ